MGVAYNPSIIRTGLQLYLDAANTKSYPGSGATWFDLSGNGIDFTNDGATFNAGGYWQMTGGQNLDHTSIGIPLTTGVTMAVWYRQTGAGLGSPRILESWVDGAASAVQGHAIVVDTNRSLRCWLDDAGTTSLRVGSIDDATIYAQNWYYYVMTYASPSSKLYMNGEYVKAGSSTAVSLDDMDNIIIGAVGDLGFAHTSNYYTGDVAIAQIYDRELTAAEVKQNFEATRGRYGI